MLVFEIQRDLAEYGAFRAGISPFAFIQPLHLVRLADVCVGICAFASDMPIVHVIGQGLGL